MVTVRQGQESNPPPQAPRGLPGSPLRAGGGGRGEPKTFVRACVRESGRVHGDGGACAASEWFSRALAHCARLTLARVGGSAGGPGPVSTKREPGGGREGGGGGGGGGGG